MAVGDAHVFPGFLTPVLTQLSFQSHRLLFSHASAEVRYAGKKVCLNRVSNSQPPGHESDTARRSPLTHPGDLKYVLRRVENIVGKGENAGYQHFLSFPQCFQMGFGESHCTQAKSNSCQESWNRHYGTLILYSSLGLCLY